MKEKLKKIGFVRKLFFLFKDIRFLSKQAFQTFRRFRLWVGITAWFRYLFLAKIFRRLRFYEDGIGDISKETIQHNYRGLSLSSIGAFSGYRPARLFDLLRTIESVNAKEEKILIIGPRAESEIFLARSHGFKKQNIKCLDLISYSKLVDLGDMHHMPYEDNSFDVVIIGWVIAYSDNPIKACSEVVRVSKNNAIVFTGVQYSPMSNEEIGQKHGYLPGSKDRIYSNKQVASYFGDSIKTTIYDHYMSEITPEKISDLILGIRIKK